MSPAALYWSLNTLRRLTPVIGCVYAYSGPQSLIDCCLLTLSEEESGSPGGIRHPACESLELGSGGADSEEPLRGGGAVHAPLAGPGADPRR